jgi:hypothetical protein
MGMGLIGVVACTGDARGSGIVRNAFGAAILVNHGTKKKKYDAVVQFSY